MPVHHRLRFFTFPMRASRLCSLWPDVRPLRFRRVPFGRDVAFDPGGATASRTMPPILPSTVPTVSASATLPISWLNPLPHPITVYASHPPSPTTAQHSLPGGALPPYRGRSFTGRTSSASPDALGPRVRILLSVLAAYQKTLGFQPFLTKSETSFVPDFVPKRTHKSRVQGPTFRLGGESRIFSRSRRMALSMLRAVSRFHGTLSECLMIASCHLNHGTRHGPTITGFLRCRSVKSPVPLGWPQPIGNLPDLRIASTNAPLSLITVSITGDPACDRHKRDRSGAAARQVC
jgi:hypothetical protein